MPQNLNGNTAPWKQLIDDLNQFIQNSDARIQYDQGRIDGFNLAVDTIVADIHGDPYDTGNVDENGNPIIATMYWNDELWYA